LLVDMLVASDKTTAQCPAGDRTEGADNDDDDEESFEKLFEHLRVMKGLVAAVSCSFRIISHHRIIWICYGAPIRSSEAQYKAK